MRRVSRIVRWAALAALALAPAAAAPAASAPDSASAAPPDVAPAAAAPATAAPEHVAPLPPARPRLEPFGDLRLRHERTEDIPGRTAGVTRARVTLRAGARWAAHARFGAELSARAAAGSDEDREFPRVDNDAPDTLQLDRALVWTVPWAGARLRAGRMAMPLALTELLWDDDLRPWGVALTHRQAVGALDVARAGAGVWRRDELADDGVVGVAQAGWVVREGAEASAAATASWLWFDDTQHLARGDLGRQNRVLGAGAARVYATRFRIVDLQLEARLPAGPLALVAAVDLARNVEAGADRDAVRTRLSAGRFGSGPGAEAGWSYLRAEQEALPGAFASDDWWSRTRASGHLGWVTFGWSDWLRLRAWATAERRDGSPARTRRAVVELAVRAPGR